MVLGFVRLRIKVCLKIVLKGIIVFVVVCFFEVRVV